jgi:hypothetical protein
MTMFTSLMVYDQNRTTNHFRMQLGDDDLDRVLDRMTRSFGPGIGSLVTQKLEDFDP